MKDSCVFCKIALGEVPCANIWEDSEHLAFLDINPNVHGMTLVITKEHHPSYAFAMAEDAYARLLLASRHVSLMLDARLPVRRTAMVMEGMGVDHTHIKLYPLHGLKTDFGEMWGPKRAYFERYEGYISTLLGPEADPGALADLAARLRG